MAIFQGEETVVIDGPNGPIRVPASVAAQLQMSAPAPEQVTVGEYNLPAVGSGVKPTPPPPPKEPIKPPPTQKVAANAAKPGFEVAAPAQAPSQNAADYAPPREDVVDATSGAAPRTDAQGRMVAPPAPSSAKPAPQGTGAQQIKAGLPGALDAQQAALAQRAQAGRNVADAEALRERALAEAYEAQAAKQDQIFAEQKRQADESLRLIQQKTTQFESASAKYANAKVDRKSDHPLMGIIGVALGMMGSALKNESTNPGLDALMKGLDRKVAGQEADLSRQKDVLGFKQQELGNLRSLASDQRARHDLLLSAETQRAALMVKKIGAQSNSDVVKARADELAADLMMRGADLRAAAVDKQIAADQKEKELKLRDTESLRSYKVGMGQVGVGMARIKEDKRQFDLRLDFDKQKAEDDLLKSLATAKAAGNTERAKAIAKAAEENSQRGVKNVATSRPLLNKEGNAKLAEADKLEAEAAKMEAELAKAKDVKPEMLAAGRQRVEAIRQKAADTRTDALTFHQALGRDPTQMGRIGDLYASAQDATSIIDDIKESYSKNGKYYFKTDADRAAVQSKVVELMMKMKNTWQLGVLSKQDSALITQATGGDPTSGWTTGNIASFVDAEIGEDPAAFMGRLDSLVAGMQKGTINTLRANTTWDGSDPDKLFFKRRGTPDSAPVGKAREAFDAKTPEEQQAGTERSAFGRVGQEASYLPGTVASTIAGRPSSAKTREEEGITATRSNRAGYGGLTKDQESAVRDLIAEAKKPGDAGAKARTLLTGQVLQQDRPELARATAEALREDAPDLYKQIRPGITNKYVGEQLDIGERPRANPLEGNRSVEAIGQQAIVGNALAMSKLRELAKTDESAQYWLKAAEKVIATRGY